MKIENESTIDMSIKDNVASSNNREKVIDKKAEENIQKKTEEKNKSTSDLNSTADKDIRNIKILDRLLKFDVVETENENGINSKKIVVSVLDEETGKVLRKIPAEEVKAEFDNLSKFVGIMFDKLG